MIEFLAACVVAGTPLAFATVGELITEKTGNLNLGVEGMMLMGAVMGFFTGLNTANPFMALAAAALAGAGGALIYAFVTVSLKANQVVTGLTLTIFQNFILNATIMPMEAIISGIALIIVCLIRSPVPTDPMIIS